MCIQKYLQLILFTVDPQSLSNILIKGMVLCLTNLLHSPVLTIKIILFYQQDET